MSRTSRLFELISILRAARMPVTAAQLSDNLGISQRSAYRDIETLRSLGAPIDGQAGMGFRLREGFFLPNLAFSTEELDALVLGLGWVQQKADPALARCSASALAKILSFRHADPFTPADPPVLTAASPSERVDAPHVALLRDAIRKQRKVGIGYVDGQGSITERTIWPMVIVYFDDVRVLAAWCEKRAAFRHFRLDRLEVRSVSTERYPERRQTMMTRWQEHDRDWRSILTVSDA